jgi:broad specificity phosphatase PhoE
MIETDTSPHGRSVKLWLVRHGQTSFGEEDYDRLSRLGMEQSRVPGTHCARTGLRFDAVYSGEMKRQRDTAGLVLERQPVQPPPAPTIRSEFNEYDFKSIIRALLPGLAAELGLADNAFAAIRGDRKAFQKLFNTLYSRWVAGTDDSADIESYRQYISRIEKGLRPVAENSRPGQNIAIFTSGGVISAVLQLALDLPDSIATELGWRIRNTSVSLFTARPGPAAGAGSPLRCRLMSFNSTAHLALTGNPDLATYR